MSWMRSGTELGQFLRIFLFTFLWMSTAAVEIGALTIRTEIILLRRPKAHEMFLNLDMSVLA